MRNPLGQFVKGVVPHNKKDRIVKTCPSCLNEFSVIPALSRQESCSRKCARKKVGATRPKGTKFSLEHRIKLSVARIKNNISGVRHPAYKADRSLLIKSEKKHLDTRYREWAMGVKNRDGWQCRIANDDCSGRLESHHILRWKDCPKLRYKLNNGITLCAFHHPKKKSEELRLSPFFQELVGDKVNSNWH